MTTYSGSCHCGRIRVALETDLAPESFTPRSCLCGFCRMHSSAAVSDPDGKITFWAANRDDVSFYRHGLGLTDFIVCKTCGVYMGALMPYDDGTAVANVMVKTLDDGDRFTQSSASVIRTEEDEAGKRTRRRAQWSPASFEERSA